MSEGRCTVARLLMTPHVRAPFLSRVLLHAAAGRRCRTGSVSNVSSVPRVVPQLRGCEKIARPFVASASLPAGVRRVAPTGCRRYVPVASKKTSEGVDRRVVVWPLAPRQRGEGDTERSGVRVRGAESARSRPLIRPSATFSPHAGRRATNRTLYCDAGIPFLTINRCASRAVPSLRMAAGKGWESISSQPLRMTAKPERLS